MAFQSDMSDHATHERRDAVEIVTAKSEPGFDPGPPDPNAPGAPPTGPGSGAGRAEVLAPLRGGRAVRWLAGPFVLLLAGGAWLWWAPAPPAASSAAPAPAVPVETAEVVRADLPVYDRGLGTVQAFNTVTIKARVDGQIQTIAFTEGQKVSKGDLLVRLDPAPYQAAYDQAVAKKTQDEAQLANARLDLQRYQQLAVSNYASRQQLDTQKALVAQLEATIRVDQGAIDGAKVQLDYTTITSPIDGVAGIRQVDIGNIVHAGDATGIVVVTQLQPVSVVFTLPEEERQSVAAAMAAGPVAVAALSRDGITELDRGTVLLIDNEIDQGTGTMRLKATFPNPGNALWPGQFVNVRLLVRMEEGVTTVPAAAVQRGPNGLYAYVVRSDQTVEMRAIAVARTEGTDSVVTAGLQPGEVVVTAGQYRLDQGTRVAAKPARAAATARDRS
ncbi:efflux RND transporter periplasmic adaptor subunit [Phreatobacter sp. AB_2022a]|uniref:efflux RND transporter periplasmic adaptor subunit n=1 Tax=Phreatobacter sp. AB_2022a TaxID=3003134 RepID=UPI002286CF6C|nr:efflux RND transporter periplasmic adaptor subunit [Phreatobacter sp. AB_2022a]MCZ0736646.1 efflux RND transporter periplasmic adaptor subunit [Phreatobacter sp. AB_2022a]